MPTVHASAVMVGSRALLIRGPSGSGKSRLCLALIEAASSGRLPFARLVADDRTHVEAANGRLLVRPAEALAGLLEIRGVGIWRLPYEPIAVLERVVDLAASDAERLPAGQETLKLEGVSLPRLALPSGVAPLPVLLAVLGRTGVER